MSATVTSWYEAWIGEHLCRLDPSPGSSPHADILRTCHDGTVNSVRLRCGLAALVLVVVSLFTGCTQRTSEVPVGGSVKVELYHCGFEPLAYRGKIWEVAPPEPFDATNAPASWKGTGTVTTVTETRLLYRDESGVEVEFVPDDGVPPPPCA